MSRHSTACTAQLSNGFPLCEEFTSLATGAGAWGCQRDWLPSVQFDPSRLGIIRGYTGQGVATSNLAGRLLSSLIGNCPSGLEKLPLAPFPGLGAGASTLVARQIYAKGISTD